MRPWEWAATLIASHALFACGSAASTAVDDDAELTRLERIGKLAFFDGALSEPAGTSCSSCHDPALAFSGNNRSDTGVALGSDGVSLGLRNTPSAMYAAFAPEFSFALIDGESTPVGGQFLDGRAARLEDQARLPFFQPNEMNNAGDAALAAKIANSAYAPLLTEEFGAAVLSDPSRTVDAVASAIAAFERTKRFSPFTSKYDAFIAGNAVLTAQESRGLELFTDTEKGNCAACHVVNPKSANPRDSLFTDFTYDNLGVPRNPRIPANADPGFFDLGLCGPKRPPVDDPSLCGAFKVPTLRNVSRKVAFMHNGYFSSLRDVVAFYVTRDTDPARWYPNGRKFDDLPARYQGNVNVEEVPYDRKSGEAPRLDDAEIDAIVAFLATLDDRYGTAAAASGK
jgi:cytochrome c peroxidase